MAPPPKITTSWGATGEDRVGRNLTNEAQRLRRVSFGNPGFGVLVMLGIYGHASRFLKSPILVGPELPRKSLNLAIFATFLGVIDIAFRRLRG